MLEVAEDDPGEKTEEDGGGEGDEPHSHHLIKDSAVASPLHSSVWNSLIEKTWSPCWPWPLPSTW